MTRRLLYLNGLATLAVVLYHSSGWGFVSMFWWTHRYLPVTTPNFDQMYSPPYYALRFVEQLIMFAIPTFLFMSGFFVAFAAGRDQPTVKWGLVRSRIWYLVIPYLFWSAVMLFAEFLQGQTRSPGGYLRLIVFGQTTEAFYFIPLLCQLYLLSPFLALLARRRWKLLLLSTALLQTVAHAVRYAVILGIEMPGAEALTALTPGRFFPGNIFWFASGIVAGFHYPSFRLRLARIRWALLAGLIVLLPLGVVEWEVLLKLSGQTWLTPKETLLDNLYAATFILSFLAFNRVAYPFSKKLADLGSKSFGIYLVHSLALTYASKAVYHLAPWILSSQALFQPLLIAAGLGLPLLLMALVKNSPARRIYVYQFG